MRMDNNDDARKHADKTAEAINVLAGQVSTIAGQAIGLQMAVGAIIDSSPDRDALCATIWSAWERVHTGAKASPTSESRELLLQSIAALLKQIGVQGPPSGG
jgi:hypothetical protein